MPKRTEKIQVSLSPEEIEQIEEWQFKHRVPSRAAAIRELIGRSVDSELPVVEDRLHSRDFGILETKLAREGKPSFTVADPTIDDMPLIYASTGFYELTEYEPEEVIGKNCRFLQGRKTEKENTALIRNALEKGELVAVDLVNYRKNKSAYRVRVKIEPVFDLAGEKPILFIGTQTFLGNL